MSDSPIEATPAEAAPRPRRSRWRLIAIAVAMTLVIAVGIGGALVAVTVRKPLPQLDGELSVPGMSSEVVVYRDAQGVPQIYADSAEDLFRAQGLVHAQDRFFQMDLRRHITAGRLSELVGASDEALAADQAIRTMGWRRVAEAEYRDVTPVVKSYLQAYAEGVNAYLDSREPSSLAVEYQLLAQQVEVAQPEPWSPVDSVTWLKAMAWDLRGNYDDELARSEMYAQFSATSGGDTAAVMALVNELFPPYPETNRTILTPEQNQAGQVQPMMAAASDHVLASVDGQQALASARTALQAVPHLLGEGEGIGSNSWVVSGEYTETGQPILANDPHLGLDSPGVWSQIGLHCRTVSEECPFEVSGFSFAGLPGVVIGHTGEIAWGFTNMGTDVTDFFVERIRDGEYLSGNSWLPLESREERIVVNGGDDVMLTVLSTHHGPIVSDLSGLDGLMNSPAGEEFGQHAVSLAWTALTPGKNIEAVFAFNQANTIDELRAAASMFEVPAQNIVFATRDGHIGYQAPGKVPIRGEVTGGIVPADGSWPRPGYDPAYDWKGYVPFEQLPRTLDPAEGFIVAANQAVLPAGSGPFLTGDWDYGYRSEGIRTLLQAEIDAGRPITVATMNEIQNDNTSAYAQILVPVLLAQDIDSSFDAEGQDLLRDWDLQMDPDSAAAAYFAAVWRDLLKNTFWDEMPPSQRPNGGSQWLAVVAGLLDQETHQLWDDKRTIGVVEGRDEILTRSLVSARRGLTVDLSKDPQDWSWGALHRLELEHELLKPSLLPGVINDYLTPDPVGVGGGSSIVNAIGWNAATDSFQATSGPSMRMVIDLSDLDQSTWIVVTGVSGHPASQYFGDQLAAWAEGETYPWAFSKEAVTQAAEHTLTLTP